MHEICSNILCLLKGQLSEDNWCMSSWLLRKYLEFKNEIKMTIGNQHPIFRHWRHNYCKKKKKDDSSKSFFVGILIHREIGILKFIRQHHIDNSWSKDLLDLYLYRMWLMDLVLLLSKESLNITFRLKVALIKSLSDI